MGKGGYSVPGTRAQASPDSTAGGREQLSHYSAYLDQFLPGLSPPHSRASRRLSRVTWELRASEKSQVWLEVPSSVPRAPTSRQFVNLVGVRSRGGFLFPLSLSRAPALTHCPSVLQYLKPKVRVFPPKSDPDASPAGLWCNPLCSKKPVPDTRGQPLTSSGTHGQT